MALRSFTDAAGVVQIQGYPVGHRGRYVYHLVQAVKDVGSRAKHVAQYITDFGLVPAEVEDLHQRLAELDTRRAAPKPPPQPPPAWVDEPATEKQIAALAKYHLIAPPTMTKGEARDVLSRARTEWRKREAAAEGGGLLEKIQILLWREEFAAYMPKGHKE